MGGIGLGFLDIHHSQDALGTRIGAAKSNRNVAGGGALAQIARIGLFVGRVEVTAFGGKGEPLRQLFNWYCADDGACAFGGHQCLPEVDHADGLVVFVGDEDKSKRR